jgi:hypothetical protein
MQLGTRWSVGEAPPSRLPEAVRVAIGDIEAQAAELDTTSWRWTLTWLEGRPHVELDDGTIIRYDPAADEAIVEAAGD